MVTVYLKFGLFSVLRHFPGDLGASSDTRYYWARHNLRLGGTKKAFAAAVARLGPESVCIDLGANVGTISEILISRAGVVHAFEPDPWAFSELKKALGGRHGMVLHHKAIGASDGSIALHRDPGVNENQAARTQGTSAYSSLLWSDGEPETFRIEQVGICRFLRDLGRKVDLLKIDIEGAEVDLLDALLSSPELDLVNEIFVETHEAQIPQLRKRTELLRQRVAKLERPVIHLDWT